MAEATAPHTERTANVYQGMNPTFTTTVHTAQEFGVPGPAEQTVLLTTVVEKDGRNSQLTNINRSSALPAHHEEALCAANMFPDFIPDKMNGEVIRSKFLSPVKFRFQ